jgi:hypothetical protein
MARIDGYGPGIRARERRQRVCFGPVIEAQHNDAHGVGHQLAKIGPPLEGLGHPGHVALRAFGEPGGETLTRLRRELGRCDPTGVEAERPRFFA